MQPVAEPKPDIHQGQRHHAQRVGQHHGAQAGERQLGQVLGARLPSHSVHTFQLHEPHCERAGSTPVASHSMQHSASAGFWVTAGGKGADVGVSTANATPLGLEPPNRVAPHSAQISKWPGWNSLHMSATSAERMPGSGVGESPGPDEATGDRVTRAQARATTWVPRRRDRWLSLEIWASTTDSAALRHALASFSGVRAASSTASASRQAASVRPRGEAACAAASSASPSAAVRRAVRVVEAAWRSARRASSSAAARRRASAVSKPPVASTRARLVRRSSGVGPSASRLCRRGCGLRSGQGDGERPSPASAAVAHTPRRFATPARLLQPAPRRGGGRLRLRGAR